MVRKSPRLNKSKRKKRCPKGSVRNPVSKECEKKKRRLRSNSKRTRRCPNGTRRNPPKTGQCKKRNLTGGSYGTTNRPSTPHPRKHDSGSGSDPGSPPSDPNLEISPGQETQPFSPTEATEQILDLEWKNDAHGNELSRLNDVQLLYADLTAENKQEIETIKRMLQKIVTQVIK